MQPRLPIASAAFQIPDPADEGTPHSTNILFMFHLRGSDEARAKLDQVGRQLGRDPPQREVQGPWTIYRQQDIQDGVPYTILEAKRELETVAASLMLAYPHLPAHAEGHDDAMEQAFRAALASVEEHVGPYFADPGEVIRRPK